MKMPEETMAAARRLDDPGKGALAGTDPVGGIMKERDRPLLSLVDTRKVFDGLEQLPALLLKCREGLLQGLRSKFLIRRTPRCRS